MQQIDEKSLRAYRKWVKMCRKMGLLTARMGDWEYSAEIKVPKASRSLTKDKKDSMIEGLVHDPSAAMPNDSEMLYYSTDSFDSIRNSRKDPVPRV